MHFLILLSLELIITAQDRRVFIILAVFLNNKENRLIVGLFIYDGYTK